MQIFENKTRLEALQLGAATNLQHDKMIKEDTLPQRWHWTRTMAVYEKADVPFGKKVSMKLYDKDETWEFSIPKKYQGKANVVLLAEIDKNEVKQEGNRIILSPKEITAKPMPKKDGWHLPDEFGFPSGNEINSDNSNARKLWRRDDCAFVGLLSRGDGDFGDGRRYVDAGDRDYGRYGVVINNLGTSGKTDLKPLAQEAKKALDKMRGVVKEELLTPLKDLVEAANKC